MTDSARNWHKALVGPHDSVLQAMRAIDRSSLQIALVVDEERRMLGVLTDGDIRKRILQGVSLEGPIEPFMNRTPVTANAAEPRDEMLARMRARHVRQLPLLDGKQRVVGMVTIDDLLAVQARSNLVVLMAGGAGARLRPLTEATPKPMLKVGDRPVLETILLQFREYGFHRFVITLNYLADQIVTHFGDGSRFDAQIDYVHETEPLGTAGALALLPDRPTEPFFVMNGDLLTKLNFGSLMNFHMSSGAPLTMCVREHSLTMPYGVANISGDRLDHLVEKPTYRYLVNAGIYACNPDVIDLIPKGSPTTVVDVAHKLLAAQQRPAVFPIHEYWVDIGQHVDYVQATADYDNIFG